MTARHDPRATAFPQLPRVLDELTVGIVIAVPDPAAPIRYRNQRLLDILGMPPDWEGTLGELAGHLCSEPAHRVEFLERWLPAVAEGHAPGPFSCHAHTPAGRRRHVTVEGRPVEGSACLVVRDATREHRMLQALRASEERFRKLVDQAPEGIVAHDGGRIVFANASAARIMGGTDPAEFLGRPVLDFIHPDYRDLVLARMGRVVGNGVDLAPMRERFIGLDGRTIDVEVVASTIELDGQPASLVSFRDISERVREEERQRRIEERLREAQKLESLSLLAGGVAHDFNNLLMGILGNVELLRLETDLPASARERLATIERIGRRAAELAGQMLAYSGRTHQELHHADLSRIVGELHELLRASTRHRAELELALEPDLPLVHADPVQLRQVVLNLVNNAAEAIDHEHGRIAVRTGLAHLDAGDLQRFEFGDRLDPGPWVFLEVADNGAGIGPEDRRRVFEPFFSTKMDGRGLGLAAVLGIVRGHGGGVSVESTPGEGTTFRVILPASDAEEATDPVAPVPPPEAVAAAGPATILIVEDEHAVREVGATLLRRAGYEVVEAASGREALALFREYRDEIALVVLDRAMPGLDGTETLRRLRDLGFDGPVVVCSGFDKGVFDDIEGAPAAFLPKPYTGAELLRVVGTALEGRR